MRIVEKSLSFRGKCPICKNQICLFCSYNLEDEHDRENCCLKRSINKAIFYNGLRYILEIDKNEYSYQENIVVCEFTPGLSFFFFFGKILCILYSNVATKKSLRNNNKYETYINEIGRNYSK